MEVVRTAVDELFDKFGNVGSRSPFSGKITNLLLRGSFTSQEEPEETFR